MEGAGRLDTTKTWKKRRLGTIPLLELGTRHWNKLSTSCFISHYDRSCYIPLEVIVLGQHLQDEIFALGGSCVSLLFGSPSVDVMRQKFWMRFKSAIEDSSRNDSTRTHFFWYMPRVITTANKNLAATKHLHEAYNPSKLIIFRACVRASKSFEWKSFFLNWRQ